MTNHRLMILQDTIIAGNAYDDASAMRLADDLIRDESLQLWERLTALSIFDKIIGESKPLYSLEDIEAYLQEVSQ